VFLKLLRKYEGYRNLETVLISTCLSPMIEYKVEEHESFIGIMLVWVSRVDTICFVKEVLNSDF